MIARLYKSGQSRDQGMLLPPSVDDYVAAENPVRAIDAYVGSLDLAALGFAHASGGGGAGQPAYDPGDLLKLYLYGYLNQVRSSRRLEREACRNLDVMWLLKGLRPAYRTIAAFRRDNARALIATNRAFVVLARRAGLVSGEIVAIDGAFFHGNASKASIVTAQRLADRLAAIEADIAAYHAALDGNDADEADAPRGVDAVATLRALLARQAETQAAQAALADSGEGQLSRTDPDARLLAKSGQSVAGYNVQIAVDARHKLIVASAVVNDGNDTGQLHAMACAARDAVGDPAADDAPTVVADQGYYNGETIRACEADGIVAYVPEPVRGTRPQAQGRFGRAAFAYDAAADVYRCPADEVLRPNQTATVDASGKRRVRYSSRRGVCRGCALRASCLSKAGSRRDVYRWEHRDVLDRMAERMRQDGAAMMRRRKALAEHPFGTIKCRAGYRHFLVRGFERVRGEWSLMALAYNLARMINIIGPVRLIARLAWRLRAILEHLVAQMLQTASTRSDETSLTALCHAHA